MQELSSQFSFQARYFKLGEINERTRQIWFVLHGYGQLAKYFLSKFKSVAERDICVIAPEGLSRFYLENVVTRSQTGNTRVGASWMTRENRLMDIENYIQYLNSVYDREITQTRKIPVTILGFSQGAATASRWVLSQTVQFNRLILWAGIFPEDIDFEMGKGILRGKEISLVYGDSDEFLTPERLGLMKDLSRKLGVTSSPLVFQGGHHLDDDTLLKFT